MKSTTGIQKLRGRPKIGQTPIAAIRMPETLRAKVDAWIAGQPEPRPSRSEAIRRLVEAALAVANPTPDPAQSISSEEPRDA